MFNNIKIKNMNFLERDLENIIFETENEKLQQRGLPIFGTVKRQLKIGNYGIADLVSFNRDIEFNQYSQKEEPVLVITIFELKKDIVNVSAFMQSLRYAKGIKEYITKRKPDLRFYIKVKLIGSSIDNITEFCFLSEMFYNQFTDDNTGNIVSVDFFIYKYTFDGLFFDEKSNYSLTESGF